MRKAVMVGAIMTMMLTTPAIAGNTPLAGNAACWGDNNKQDISCRAITESFLMSMRGKTEAQVHESMGVKGRSIDNGLHFIRNYKSGEKYGSRDINFLVSKNLVYRNIRKS